MGLMNGPNFYKNTNLLIMLTIRLQRVGKAKKPVYRLIISEKARDTKGTYLELLGTYNPHDKVAGFNPKTERVQYWISKGAQMSETVHNLLVKAGIVTGKKQRVVHLTKKRQTKLEEKKKVEAEKKAAAAAKVEAPAPAEIPVETPVEAPAETPVESPVDVTTETPQA